MSTPERAGGHSQRWRDSPQLVPPSRRSSREGSASARPGNGADLRERIVERLVAGLAVVTFGLVGVYLLVAYWQLALFMALGAVGVGLVWWSRRPQEPAAASEAGQAALPPVTPPPPAPAGPTAAPDDWEPIDAEYRAEVLSDGWRLTFQAMPRALFVDLSGPDGADGPEVVGERDRQAALAEVASLVDGAVTRHDVVAVLVPEPTNRFDRNAVRVEVFGRLVGYLAPDDAAEISPVLLDLHRSGRVVATEAEIVGDVGRSGARPSIGIVLRIQDHSSWAQTLRGPLTVRSAEIVP